ncbi:reverse transcriptase domain-containing protein [Tanacetum coccineum]|uniref:Reverse transcriptase domain-containing protein n=1 Tax=Tanacetum coccineum TaxID=301880 RepID=A0ABQ5HYS8_9ASTR
MSFGLKNIRATYQRLVDKAFQKQIGRNSEVYVDDLVIKSRTKQEVIRDIEETFKTLREINMKLNPKKCTFGMREGMFLGYKVNADGLKVCLDKVEAVLSLPSPKCLKDVQRLNGKLASLNRFLSKSAEKSLPFFKTLKKCTKKSDFQWTAEAETTFKQMKTLIAELPMLTAPKEKEELVIYMAAAKEAISAVLMTKRARKQMPIYFVSCALQGPKINYTPMEKLILALVKMDDRNITMEEYIKLEEEKSRRRGKVFNWETAKYGKIWYDEDVHDLRSVETEFPAIVFNDNLTLNETHFCEPTKTDSENDNDKVNVPLFPSLEPTVSYFDDLDFFKDFKKEFPAIVYNDALTSKLDFLTKPTVNSQHIDEFNLKDETSLFKCDEEEQNVLNFNDLFPFNVIYPNDSKLDKDNDDDKIDIKESSGDMSVKPLPDLINTDVDAYVHGSNKLLKTSHDTSNKFFKTETFIKELNVDIMT